MPCLPEPKAPKPVIVIDRATISNKTFRASSFGSRKTYLLGNSISHPRKLDRLTKSKWDDVADNGLTGLSAYRLHQHNHAKDPDRDRRIVFCNGRQRRAL